MKKGVKKTLQTISAKRFRLGTSMLQINIILLPVAMNKKSENHWSN